MAYINSYPMRGLPPKALLHLILVVGLAFFVYAIITQNLLVATVVIFSPLAIITIGYGLQKPRFIYLMYATYAFFFTTVSRYIRQEKLSVGLDIILVYIFIAILFASYYKKADIKLSNAFNLFTISYVVWILFILIQFTNPGIHSEGITEGIRIWILRTLMLYIVASIVSNTPKMLRNSLIVIGIFIIIAFLKVLYQKYVGFDFAEKRWLYIDRAATTHILSTGIRYFSYFTDAANFGTCMGGVATAYSIIGLNTRNRQLAIFYFSIAVMGAIGMLLSGTRGALAVPVTGLALFCLLCKSLRAFTISAGIGIALFFFFAFTNIGNSNQFIRRARTAFRPAKDASFNVRVENRKEIALYLQKHPWGVGLTEDIPKMWAQGDTYIEGTLPPDSYFVRIWIETGIVGVILLISIYAVVLLRCCYIVMFRVRNKELRQTLAAFTCATFGILISGYTGEAPGMPPTNFLIAAMIAFIMNGTYIDNQITQKRLET